MMLELACGPGPVCGVDEAGRGPLAGPVVAAAVILDDEQPIAGLADSKVLTEKTRERLFDEIRAKALCCAIAEATVEEIDRLNILGATLLAMRRAVEGLRLKPGRVLVDGKDRLENIPQLKALLAAGYDGPISFEPFAEEVHALDDPEAALRESIGFVSAGVKETASAQ